jgi:MFS family permease
MTNRAELRRLAVYLFLVTSSFGFLQPFLPLYMEAAGLSKSQIGLLTGLGMGIALLVQPLLGRLSDRLDVRRPFIALSALGAAAAYFSFPLAHSLPEFLIQVARCT